MIFTPTALSGAYLIEPEPIADERGFFARSWCRREFAERGLESRLEQCNISFNRLRGTLDATADYIEGLRAFVEKRQPRFTGR